MERTLLSTPTGFAEIIEELHRKVTEAQPKDLYQFCAEYFQERLREQREHLLNLGTQHTPGVSYARSIYVQNQFRNNFHPNGITNGHVGYNYEAAIYEDTDDEDAVYLSGQEEIADEAPEENTLEIQQPELEESLADDEQEETKDTLVNPEVAAEEEKEDDDDDDDSDIIICDDPPMPIAYNRGRRTSVSAESMTPTNDGTYEKITIPKSPEQRQRIEVSLANNFLYKNLDEEQYRDVIDAMSEKKVQNGESIIRQGDVGDYFYVVETGTFDVFVAKNLEEPVKVTEYGPGGSFGELALMYNAPRAATVTATSDAVLWALDRVTFRRILMERTNTKRRMYEAFLEEVPLLVSLEHYERHKIADALESMVFCDGDVVLRQGDVGDSFYIIESGEARVTVIDDDGVEHELPSLKKGYYFGELALLNDRPRAATISAKGRLKVATLGKKAFVRLLGPVVDIIRRNTADYKVISHHIE
ncbi:camp-dependent protein kinase regulatory subunit [Basidiobolus meristosporus CBS 931.73]|uniref:cAMP-dependent protein kinase regulatory subunit n=1 Tax=Basidiobolus meristosporus CBS 931.73 TaxID=1314790 RepID=A0A1Y1XU24_9FUNG|nr:camp-dependent protein kinase regulatory subunit [Basidiobolus meristosporus CBS 931.73]|eukprot:ORX89261.1 camp-dependent protein kinase regulatory subunit [Basidiobolus meristosporus CBS 931.73]